jgi:hypothetical protein
MPLAQGLQKEKSRVRLACTTVFLVEGKSRTLELLAFDEKSTIFFSLFAHIK